MFIRLECWIYDDMFMLCYCYFYSFFVQTWQRHIDSHGHCPLDVKKVALLAKSMNLNFVSSSTFSRVQSLYAVPSIRDMWDKMKEVVWKVFENDVLVVCGDGRMDSPGFSAKYCVYTMMEHYLNATVDLEVVDKREAGGTSSLMAFTSSIWLAIGK